MNEFSLLKCKSRNSKWIFIDDSSQFLSSVAPAEKFANSWCTRRVQMRASWRTRLSPRWRALLGRIPDRAYAKQLL
jgi:hypothetical protein